MEQEYFDEFKDLLAEQLRRLTFDKEELRFWYKNIAEMSSDKIVNQYSDQLKESSALYETPRALVFQDLKSKGTLGYYAASDNVISLDRTNAFFHKSQSALTAIHEGVHYGQARVMNRLKELSEPEHWCMAKDNREVRDTFGMQTYGNTYIKSKIPNSVNPTLRHRHYTMQFVERQAREETIEIGKHVGLNTKKHEQSLEMNKHLIKAQYSCHKMDDKEFFQVFDSAQMKVARQMQPSSALEANIMYDIAALMHEQEVGKYLSPALHQSQSEFNMRYDTKAMTLMDAGFEYSNVIPMYEASNMSLQEISELGQWTLDQSPLFVMASMGVHGKDMEPFVNRESFDKWYFENNHRFSQRGLDTVGSVLGPEYAVKHEPNIDIQDILQEEDSILAKETPDMDLREILETEEDIQFSNMIKSVFGDNRIDASELMTQDVVEFVDEFEEVTEVLEETLESTEEILDIGGR